MKNILFLALLTFVLATGIISGLAYERYLHREECLKLAFDNSGEEVLSEEEINEITKVLNSDGLVEDNTPSPAKAGYSYPEETGSNLPVREVSECLLPGRTGNDGGVCEKSLVGSKNSNKFYPADCRYAKLIKEENKIFFASVEDGEKAGRTFVECK